MEEVSKEDRRRAKEIIKKGILHRHAEWQQELRALLDKPLKEDENEYDRSLTITDTARKFYKEAMLMDEWFKNSMLIIGLANLYLGQHITDEDLEELPEETQGKVLGLCRRAGQ